MTDRPKSTRLAHVDIEGAAPLGVNTDGPLYRPLKFLANAELLAVADPALKEWAEYVVQLRTMRAAAERAWRRACKLGDELAEERDELKAVEHKKIVAMGPCCDHWRDKLGEMVDRAKHRRFMAAGWKRLARRQAKTMAERIRLDNEELERASTSGDVQTRADADAGKRLLVDSVRHTGEGVAPFGTCEG